MRATNNPFGAPRFDSADGLAREGFQTMTDTDADTTDDAPDKGHIALPRDEFERHNERRKELGVTWAEYLDGARPIEALRHRLDRVEQKAGQAAVYAEQAARHTDPREDNGDA